VTGAAQEALATWFAKIAIVADATRSTISTPSQLASETARVYEVHFKPVEPLSARLTLIVLRTTRGSLGLLADKTLAGPGGTRMERRKASDFP
jgi:hypothetical protein